MATPTFVFFLILGFITLAQGQGNGFCNLVWSDEFSGTTLSPAWQKEATCKGGGNNEMQCYTTRDKNIFLNNGDLVLRAYRERFTGSAAGCTDNEGCTWTKDYTSGRVNTRPGASWTYGRFETRAKIPSGYQLWPAIWMMPMDYRYGGWAASGEIDIMEGRGERPHDVSGTLHHGGQWPQNVWTTTGDHSIGVDLSKDFHVYTLEWTPNYMKWYIDDVLTQNYDMNRWWNSSARNVYTAKGQPFDQRFHFILNLAVGGSFFGGAPAVTPQQADAWASPEMRVDYVRVWQQGGNCNAAPQPVPTSQPLPSQAPDNNGRPTTSAETPATVAPTPGRCNGQVYDPNSYTCTLNEASAQVLCPVGTSSCKQACYAPSQYCCKDGNLMAKAMCPAVQPTAQRPSTSTSTPATTTPNPSTPAEAAGYCNGQRYDWNLYDCTVNNGRKVLCQKGQQSCGNHCFNTSQYCCKNGALTAKSQC